MISVPLLMLIPIHTISRLSTTTLVISIISLPVPHMDLTFAKTCIHINTVYNIGTIPDRNIGNGAGGIYTNLRFGDITAYDNDVRLVLEVGIEGYFSSVHNNYIEGTGTDRLIIRSMTVQASMLPVR